MGANDVGISVLYAPGGTIRDGAHARRVAGPLSDALNEPDEAKAIESLKLARAAARERVVS